MRRSQSLSNILTSNQPSRKVSLSPMTFTTTHMNQTKPCISRTHSMEGSPLDTTETNTLASDVCPDAVEDYNHISAGSPPGESMETLGKASDANPEVALGNCSQQESHLPSEVKSDFVFFECQGVRCLGIPTPPSSNGNSPATPVDNEAAEPFTDLALALEAAAEADVSVTQMESLTNLTTTHTQTFQLDSSTTKMGISMSNQINSAEMSRSSFVEEASQVSHASSQSYTSTIGSSFTATTSQRLQTIPQHQNNGGPFVATEVNQHPQTQVVQMAPEVSVVASCDSRMNGLTVPKIKMPTFPMLSSLYPLIKQEISHKTVSLPKPARAVKNKRKKKKPIHPRADVINLTAASTAPITNLVNVPCIQLFTPASWPASRPPPPTMIRGTPLQMTSSPMILRDSAAATPGTPSSYFQIAPPCFYHRPSLHHRPSLRGRVASLPHFHDFRHHDSTVYHLPHLTVDDVCRCLQCDDWILNLELQPGCGATILQGFDYEAHCQRPLQSSPLMSSPFLRALVQPLFRDRVLQSIAPHQGRTLPSNAMIPAPPLCMSDKCFVGSSKQDSRPSSCGTAVPGIMQTAPLNLSLSKNCNA